MALILPCDNSILREDVCQRKTFKINPGERLHISVEKSMADFFEREINLHLKIEMMKA
jgi:hypothetical protein